VAETPAAQPAPGSSASPGRPRVVAAAVEPSRRAAVIAALNQVVAAGGSALLVTADGGSRPLVLASEVEVLDLVAGERQLCVNRLLTRDPRRLLARVTGDRPVADPSAAWSRLTRSRLYQLIRPWLLWRVLRAHLVEVRVRDVDHVVIVHQNSWPIAWQLHRRNPAITIAYEIPDEVWRRVGRLTPAAESAERSVPGSAGGRRSVRGPLRRG
jgi:hypothetical protein